MSNTTYDYAGFSPYSAGDMWIIDQYASDDFDGFNGNATEECINNGARFEIENSNSAHLLFGDGVKAMFVRNRNIEMVPISVYAERNNRSVHSVRQKCQRNGFETAEKVGRDWFINLYEPYSDNRKK